MNEQDIRAIVRDEIAKYARVVAAGGRYMTAGEFVGVPDDVLDANIEAQRSGGRTGDAAPTTADASPLESGRNAASPTFDINALAKEINDATHEDVQDCLSEHKRGPCDWYYGWRRIASIIEKHVSGATVGDDGDESPCPKNDPSCEGDEDSCHDACEWPNGEQGDGASVPGDSGPKAGHIMERGSGCPASDHHADRETSTPQGPKDPAPSPATAPVPPHPDLCECGHMRAMHFDEDGDHNGPCLHQLHAGTPFCRCDMFHAANPRPLPLTPAAPTKLAPWPTTYTDTPDKGVMYAPWNEVAPALHARDERIAELIAERDALRARVAELMARKLTVTQKQRESMIAAMARIVPSEATTLDTALRAAGIEVTP